MTELPPTEWALPASRGLGAGGGGSVPLPPREHETATCLQSLAPGESLTSESGLLRFSASWYCLVFSQARHKKPGAGEHGLRGTADAVWLYPSPTLPALPGPRGPGWNARRGQGMLSLSLFYFVLCFPLITCCSHFPVSAPDQLG